MHIFPNLLVWMPYSSKFFRVRCLSQTQSHLLFSRPNTPFCLRMVCMVSLLVAFASFALNKTTDKFLLKFLLKFGSVFVNVVPILSPFSSLRLRLITLASVAYPISQFSSFLRESCQPENGVQLSSQFIWVRLSSLPLLVIVFFLICCIWP